MNSLLRISTCASLLVLVSCGGGSDVATLGAPRQAAGVIQSAPQPATTLPGNRSQYTIAASGSNFVLTDIVTSTSTTYGISDRLRFADGGVAFDLNGAAGKAYRLYQAAFNRKPDLQGLGYYINVLDNPEVRLDAVAEGFVASAEFSSLYGNVSNAQFLTVMYANVLKRAPDPDGFAWHLDKLEGTSGVKITRGQDLMTFSESQENYALVAPAIANGIDYIPWGMEPLSTPVGNFAASYSGSFRGADGGALNVVVDASGNVAIGARANSAGADLAGSGTLQPGGAFTATASGGGRTLRMSGSINLQLGYATGTWIFDGGGSGVFLGAKVGAPPPPPPQVTFTRVQAIIAQRCAPCHSANPTQPGFGSAPLGIMFDTGAQIRSRSAQINALAVQSQIMPYGNLTNMTQAERNELASWFAAGQP